MTYALPLPRPAPIKLGLLLILTVAYMVACAVSLAPTIGRTDGLANHSEVCHCAHCDGGPNCCCRQSGKCPTP